MRNVCLLCMCLCALTLWAQTEIPRPEHPRPQFVRDSWVNLNGQWTYTFDFGDTGLERGLAKSEGFDGNITVPFCPESKLSGVEYKDFINCMWYQRKVDVPAAWEGKKIMLNFGAVDYYSTIYVNGHLAGRHWGGTSSFAVDMTPYVKAGEKANIVVCVKDDIRQGEQTGGKQSRVYYSEGCYYTRVTGIWQTVWMEAVAPAGLKEVYVKPDLDNSCFVLEPKFHALEKGLSLQVKLKDGNKVVASKKVKATTPMTVIL